MTIEPPRPFQKHIITDARHIDSHIASQNKNGYKVVTMACDNFNNILLVVERIDGYVT